MLLNDKLWEYQNTFISKYHCFFLHILLMFMILILKKSVKLVSMKGLQKNCKKLVYWFFIPSLYNIRILNSSLVGRRHIESVQSFPEFFWKLNVWKSIILKINMIIYCYSLTGDLFPDRIRLFITWITIVLSLTIKIHWYSIYHLIGLLSFPLSFTEKF